MTPSDVAAVRTLIVEARHPLLDGRLQARRVVDLDDHLPGRRRHHRTVEGEGHLAAERRGEVGAEVDAGRGLELGEPADAGRGPAGDGAPAAADWKLARSSSISAGLLTTNAAAIAASGEMNSSEPIGPGAASHETMPRRASVDGDLGGGHRPLALAAVLDDQVAQVGEAEALERGLVVGRAAGGEANSSPRSPANSHSTPSA